MLVVCKVVKVYTGHKNEQQREEVVRLVFRIVKNIVKAYLGETVIVRGVNFL